MYWNKKQIESSFERRNKMAKDRSIPCKYYIAFGMCSKSREANHNGYCQKCNKYVPRVRERHKNLKKEKLEKIRKNDVY